MAEDRSDHGGKNADRDRDNTDDGDIEEEEPDFSDPEGFVDDVTDEDLLGDILKNKPKETDGIDSIIVVDNIPQVGEDRVEKLQNVIRKIFSKFGKILSEHYPQEDGTTKGYCFFEYSSPQHAEEAVKQANGCKLDKQHTFLVNLFSDFDRYTNVPDEWIPPEPQPYKSLGNLRHWLLDSDCLDQFSVIYDAGERTAIFANGTQEPVLLEERQHWTETFVCWSPQGTYLATFHSKGIALWGGENFQQIMRFNHTGVQLIDFSPCERYMVTFSPLMDSREEPQAIIVWDILTGLKKRGFHCDNQSTWPILKWSYDGSYFARHGEDIISVYETPSFGLLDKKSLKVSGMRDFTWSPADNYIAYWVGEQENVPCRVVLIEIPSRIELCVRNLFNVADCKMHWQKQGDYLCVKVDRYTKAKKIEERDKWKYSGITYNFELFRIREKQVPVDKVECKESVVAFAWEPNGSRFAFIHGESPRISVSFYEIRTGGKVVLVKTIEKRQANHLFWCPNGQFIVVAGLRSMNGILEFIDTSDVTVMAQTEHFMAMDVEWDPTGRYVTTAVSWWGHKMDNAYWIWNFQGKLLKKQAPDRFCQFLWRPRPPTLLAPDQVKEIKKTFKKYAAQFEMKDKISQSTASKEKIEERRAMRAEFVKYRNEKEEEFLQYKDRRLALRDDIDTDELDSHIENMEEETIEFLLKVEETIIDEE